MDEEEEEQEQEEPVVMAIESLSPSQIVELVELSFLQSVFAMAQGKLEELQLFIIAVKTASTHEPSVSNLLKSLDDLADQRKLVPDTTTEKEDRPRPLDPKERALRSTWIQVIYWLVAYLSSQEEDNTTTIIDVEDIDPTITKRYSTEIIDDLVAIQKSGLGLNAQAFVERRQEHFFPTATNNPLLLDEQDAIDPIDKAIVSQTIKVLFYTLLVLADDGDNATIITDSPSTTSSDNYSMETESSASEKEESSPEESSKTSKKQSKSKTKRSGGRGFGG